MVKIKPDSAVKFNKLAIRKVEKDYVVNFPGTNVHTWINDYDLQAYKYLKKGYTVKQTQDLLGSVNFVRYDVKSFVKWFVNYGFIKSVDDKKLERKQKNIHFMLNFLTPNIAKKYFSPISNYIWGFFVLIGFAILISDWSTYFVTWQDYRFHDSIAVSILANLFFSHFFLALHEISHLMGARLHNKKAYFDISHRLTFLVFVTDLTTLFQLPRNKRYTAYLAGMRLDSFFFAIFTILLFTMNAVGAEQGMFYLFIKSLRLPLLFGLVWQCFFILRTDLYLFIRDVLDIKALHWKAKEYLKYMFRKVFNSKVRLKPYLKQNTKTIKYYSILLFFGTLFTFYFFFTVQVPMIFSMLYEGIRGLVAPENWGHLADSLSLLLMVGLINTLLVYAIHKEHHLNLSYLKGTWKNLLKFLGIKHRTVRGRAHR